MAFAPDRIARVNEILKREIAAILEKENITRENTALIQKRIAKTIVLKYTPVLRFTADRNLEEGDRVLNILRELEEEK